MDGASTSGQFESFEPTGFLVLRFLCIPFVLLPTTHIDFCTRANNLSSLPNWWAVFSLQVQDLNKSWLLNQASMVRCPSTTHDFICLLLWTAAGRHASVCRLFHFYFLHTLHVQLLLLSLPPPLHSAWISLVSPSTNNRLARELLIIPISDYPFIVHSGTHCAILFRSVIGTSFVNWRLQHNPGSLPIFRTTAAYRVIKKDLPTMLLY